MKKLFKKQLISSGKMPVAHKVKMNIFGLWPWSKLTTVAKNLAALKRALLAKLPQAQKLLLLRSLQLLQSLQKQQKQLKNLSNFSFWNLKKTPQIAEFFIALFYLKLSIRLHFFYPLFATHTEQILQVKNLFQQANFRYIFCYVKSVLTSVVST